MILRDRHGGERMGEHLVALAEKFDLPFTIGKHANVLEGGDMGIAVVTGTSTGIGLSTAITLGRGGHTVFAPLSRRGQAAMPA
jgi:hypothetical protein